MLVNRRLLERLPADLSLLVLDKPEHTRFVWVQHLGSIIHVLVNRRVNLKVETS